MDNVYHLARQSPVMIRLVAQPYSSPTASLNATDSHRSETCFDWDSSFRIYFYFAAVQLCHFRPLLAAKLGRYQVTDVARLICMEASKSNAYFPQQQDVLDALADAGVEAKMTTVGGAFLLECIAINPGSRCRTWRLVTTNSAAKAAMMRRFQQFKNPLKDAKLEASDWTWGRRY